MRSSALRRLWSKYGQLVDREAARSSFLLLAAHELRTPVALARGYVDIFQSGAFGELSPAGREALKAMDAKLGEMALLVQEMAETARLQDPEPRLKLEELAAAELVSDAVERVRPLAGPRHRITVDDESRLVRLRGDRGRMLTLLTNLLGNAIKYSPEGGTITVGLRSSRRLLRISVQDEGIGIPPEQLDRLFRPFTRLGQERAKGIAGTGVGLYLCREIARAHAGDLTAESDGKGGSTFVLTLPAM